MHKYNKECNMGTVASYYNRLTKALHIYISIIYIYVRVPYVYIISKLYSQGILLLRVWEDLVQCVLFSSMLNGIRVFK